MATTEHVKAATAAHRAIRARAHELSRAEAARRLAEAQAAVARAEAAP